MLQIKEISKRFGGLMALADVSFEVSKGVIAGLIGPNGSGKTTLFNIISGLLEPDKGLIKFNGKEISGMAPEKICHRGIGRTFQIVMPFQELSVTENVMVAVMYGGKKRRSIQEAKAVAKDLLDFVGLSDKKPLAAKNLTLAETKRLEVARALATEPQLLLLDEVLAGLNPNEIEQNMRLIRKINGEFGITILMIEHVMKALMGLSVQVVALHYGKKIAEGKPEEVTKHPEVIKAYLGTKYAQHK